MQCPELDGVNAILIHSLALLLLYPQHTDGNAWGPVCLHTASCASQKRQKSLNPQGWPSYSLHKVPWKRGQTWPDHVLCSPVSQPLSCCTGLQRISLVLSEGRAALLTPVPALLCQSTQGCANPLIWGIVTGKFYNAKLLKPRSSPKPKPCISLVHINASQHIAWSTLEDF